MTLDTRYFNFTAGHYLTRNGMPAEVFIEKDGQLWGRIGWHGDMRRAQSAQWDLDGKSRGAYEESYNLDLMRPTPV